MTKPKLLFLAHRIPYPPTKGEKLRAFHLIKGLSERYDVHLGALVDDEDDWRTRDALQEHCAACHFADIRGRTRETAALHALTRREPVTYAYFRHRGLATWVRDVTAAHEFEVALFYSSGVAPYIDAMSRPPRATIVDFVDVDSAKWEALGRRGRGPTAGLYRREARLLSAEEKRIAERVDLSLFVTETEAALFRKRSESAAPLAVVGNGVDVPYWREGKDLPSPYGPGEVSRVVMTGIMDYEPNVDAAQWFAKEPLARLRAHERRIEFVLAGARPSKDVQALDSRPEIRVTGAVKDMRGWLAHADVAVAPLRVARGLQNKVLEAMAAGTPIVVTPEALEGIDARAGEDLIVCSGGAEFAQAVAMLLDDADARARLAANAQAYVAANHGWESMIARLHGVLDGVLAGQGDRSAA